ncbi:MAG: tail fiber protein [Opitutaceae bacterium]
MADPFIGEIRMFGGNFAPNGWALCNGQMMSVSQYAALFSLLGTSFGGNGQTTFGLPNLQCRLPMHWGSAPGLSVRTLGEFAGAENATLTIANLPTHTHTAVFTPSGGGAAQVNVTAAIGNLPTPAGNMLGQSPASGPTQAPIYAPPTSPVAGQLAGVSGGGGGGTVAVGMTGNGLPASTISPFLAVTFIIALVGIYPSRG